MSKSTTAAKPAQSAALAVNETNSAPDKLSADMTEQSNKPAPADAPPAVNEPTSDKLTAIRAEQDVLMAQQSDANLDRKQRLELNMKLFKLTSDENAEIAAIKRAEAELLLADKRNARAKLFYDAVDAIKMEYKHYYEVFSVSGKTDADIAEMNKFTDAAKTAGEIVVNELLGKLATNTPAKSVATGTTSTVNGDKGAATGEIVAMHIANLAAGQSKTDSRKNIETAGYARSTVWHAINNWEKAQA